MRRKLRDKKQNLNRRENGKRTKFTHIKEHDKNRETTDG
jgi:hypothetical protein